MNTSARIIEVVTGMPFEQFLEERLFRPLGAGRPKAFFARLQSTHSRDA